MIKTTAPRIDGRTSRSRGTPRPTAIDPTSEIIATRKLVNCKRATARLTVLGITAVNASEMMNHTRIASRRVPKNAAVNCGRSRLNGSRITFRS